MNYRLIRQTSLIFQSNRVLLSPNSVKLRQTLINNAKSLHVSTQLNFSPRFTKDLKNNETVAELPECIGPEVLKIKEKGFSKKPDKLGRNEEDSSWDEVEKASFLVRKPKGVEIPKVSFKGNRAFIHKERSMFNMDEIDRKSKKHAGNVTQAKPAKPKPIKRISNSEEIYDQDIGKYLKLERDDPLLDKLMLKIQSKKQFDPDQKFTLEGRRLIQEGLAAGLKLETLIFSKIEQVKPIKDEILRSKAKIFKIANHNLKLWSQLTTTPGIIGIFYRPENLNDLIEKQRAKDQIIPVSIVLDNIREPNNMGAIIRVAAAAGAEQVILTKGKVLVFLLNIRKLNYFLKLITLT